MPGMRWFAYCSPFVHPARDALAPLILFAATERELRRIAAQAAPGQRVEVLAIEVPPPRR
ncbi:hypothetical protein ACFT0G_28230 [Streptomyces sp. NPDC057020]|uniref:hypothetical protein n=1 Tax=unclassified Streptomyces TaxID=2593676 RepID=UPI003626CD3B